MACYDLRALPNLQFDEEPQSYLVPTSFYLQCCLPYSMDAEPFTHRPKQAQPPVHRRKQFTSCDACRKNRRACDAVTLGVDPLQASAGPACSACKKAGRNCTFEWLKGLPDTSLPRSLKRRKASAPVAPLVASSQVDASSDGSDESPTIPPDSSADQTWIQPPAPTFHQATHLRQDDGRSFAQQPANPHLASFAANSHNNWHNPAFPLANTTQFPDNDLSNQPTDWSSNLVPHVPNQTWHASFHPHLQHPRPIPGSTQHTARPKLEDTESDSIHSKPTASGRRIEYPSPALDDELAQATSKRHISSQLVKIYSGSLEHALRCWTTEEHSPWGYASSASFSRHRSSSDSPPSYLRRIKFLDQISQPLRGKNLSIEEAKLASTSLKLAIMSFASQWTRISPSAERQSPSSPFDALSDDSVDLGFERLMQQSLWHEARRYVKACASINTFHSIFAQMVFALVQRPHLPAHETAALSDDPTTSPPLGTMQPDEERPTYLEQALRHLLEWRRHMRKIISAPVQSGSERKIAEYQLSLQQTANQMQEPFEAIFWLGIMCDTTSAALNERPVVISDDDLLPVPQASILPPVEYAPFPGETGSDSDSETSHSRDDPNTSSRSSGPAPTNVWDIDAMRHRPRLSAPTSAEAILKEGIQPKVLLWRKLGALKKLMKHPQDQRVMEQHIGSTLQAAEFWKSTYGPFMQQCINTHHQLSFNVQSWYIILAGHFHLACLLVADCIDHIDNQGWSLEGPRAARQSSYTTLKLAQVSAYSVADIAAVSTSTHPMDTSSFGSDRLLHDAISSSALLSEPWTDVLTESFSKTFQKMYTWLSCWKGRPTIFVNTNELSWLGSNTDASDLAMKCAACVDALDVLGRKSDQAASLARSIRSQLEGFTRV
ncbi:uncharacterized protein HMPREF1541_03546 [Cyphellophora europaea CBS 101466]|uniref:Zn(2)-C6 fungal-type domain-containing protein n=1 Tax=Cyphellophora europaea (strain CBS 101466) TaxID=1220924 RepID=W2RZ51_CYPE1|nr:uncharacterized protein HMPREF1541_03546 [Cyphellophora europaea CBS 101466]ETN41610.1 hypothetical protein HMPREF1541_03546 [Cyphellophora europaea CBS 101466]